MSIREKIFRVLRIYKFGECARTNLFKLVQNVIILCLWHLTNIEIDYFQRNLYELLNFYFIN